MVKNTQINKNAIHFGIAQDVKLAPDFDGEKDADYFHLFAKQKGYASDLILGSKLKISAESIKEHLHRMKKVARGAGTYFISISGVSIVERKRFNPFVSKDKRKSLILCDNETFSRKDLLDCLSIFDSEDHVFFLICDCEAARDKSKYVDKVGQAMQQEKVKTKAAVLSLGLNPRAMKHLNISSCAVDFEYAVKSANTLQDVESNLLKLNESSMQFVDSRLGCYNTHKNSALQL